MAKKTWVLDSSTKGTGANVVPLEKVLEKPEPPAERPGRPSAPAAKPRRAPAAPRRVTKTATALPAGHVRKSATGELGKVKAVDPKAGTVTVRWLRSGSVSTVPLSSVARR